MRASLLFILALFAWTSAARAQQAQDPQNPGYGGRSGANLTQGKDAPPAPPAPPPKLEPPLLTKDPGAEYPRQAIDDGVREPVTVVLVVDVDADGKVQDARVEAAAGHGFDEAATEAAKKLEFQPAKRGEKAIPSRVKHRYVFAPPPGRLVGKVSGSKSDQRC